jgi:hypothetical protein
MMEHFVALDPFERLVIDREDPVRLAAAWLLRPTTPTERVIDHYTGTIGRRSHSHLLVTLRDILGNGSCSKLGGSPIPIIWVSRNVPLGRLPTGWDYS